MNRLTVLGSGFAIASQFQENAHLLVQSDQHTVLIDCGNNPVGKLQQAGVSINQITDLILTHAHADHMGALPLLLMDMWLCKRKSPLNIYGLDYTLEKARALLDIFTWKNWAEMFPVVFHSIADDGMQSLIKADDLLISAILVKHLIPTVGLRIVFPHTQKIFAYSCDTEPCPNVLTLAKGADILIQEAAGPAKGHTSPEEAGTNAREAKVHSLVLIHYDSGRAESDLISEAHKQFNGEVLAAKDLMQFE
jgi:ribonuclease Z